MSFVYLDFEKPIEDLEQEIGRLRETPEALTDEKARVLADLEARLERTQKELYENLTPWQRVQLARHINRPHALDYIRRILTDWTELSGDRLYGDDHACVAGFARLGELPVAVIGQQKGSDVHENSFRNYGMMHPEGYRKAMRVMKMAEKFGRPIIILIDTSGAFPGIGAEERSNAEAIARNIMEMSVLRTPIICTVIGEGGSGGALGVGVGDRLLIMENAFYSVIPPEGCAAILWRDAKMAPKAAEALKITSRHLREMGIADEIIPEPLGGAHRDPSEAGRVLKEAIERNLGELQGIEMDVLIEQRFQKYRNIGAFEEQTV